MMGHLGFFISEALVSIRRSGLMMFITVCTIAISLIVFGLFLLISSNVGNLANYMNAKLEIRVFLKDDLTRSQLKNFRTDILELEHVERVVYMDKDSAWKTFKKNYQHLSPDLMDKNPLPDQFKVFLDDNRYIVSISEDLNTYSKFVDEVAYGGAIADQIQRFSRLIQYAGLFLVFILALATLFIIVNTIRLTVLNRQDEITIMQLVGATNAFISGPFIIEGLLLGGVGSVIAVLLLKSGYGLFGYHFQKAIPYFPIMTQTSTLNIIFLSVVLVGTSLGVFGAYLSISKTLKNQI